MIAIAGIDSIAAPNLPEQRNQRIRVLQSFVFIIEDITGNYHKIRIFRIDLIHHLRNL